MTLQQEVQRAQEGMATARSALRDGRLDDALIDHWAWRLTFWHDEHRRLLALLSQTPES